MNEEELYAAAVEVRVLAAIVHKMAFRDLVRRLEASNAGVSGLQYGVLRFLQRHPSTLSEMSRTMRLAPPTLLPVVDALEQKGLVERGRDPEDRRRTPLLLTAGGLQTLERLPLVGGADSLAISLQAMGDDKTRTLCELLRELTQHISGHGDLHPPGPGDLPFPMQP
jgi:DNA-binding MarR family transcriptional regulator